MSPSRTSGTDPAVRAPGSGDGAGDGSVRAHGGRRWLPALVGLVAFAVAVVVLHRGLAAVTLADIGTEFRSIPVPHVAGALALTVASYLLLTLYDAAGLRYVGSTLGWRTYAPTSFAAFAIGHNVGVASLSGGAIRYRAYSGAGLSAVDITRVVASCTVMFGLGGFLLLGTALLLEPASALESMRLPAGAGRALGAVLLLGVALYLGWATVRRRDLRVGHWSIAPPTPALALFQVAVSTIDLVIAAGVVYLLLPPDAAIGFAAFAGLYTIATMLGTVSNVPGGIGVFEGTMLLLVPQVPAPVLLGALLAYRVVYYLLPLVVALGMLAAQMLSERRGQALAVTKQGGLILTRAAPQITAVAVFAAGAVLLVSGTLPADTGRLEWLGAVLPDTVLQISHLVGSAIGLALLILAHGLYRRLQGAWFVALWLLGAGIVASLVKGFDYEESVVLLLAAGLLWAGRARFHRRASLLDEPFTAGWIASIVIVAGGAIWLGFFAYRNVDYANDLWWRFAYDDEASKMLRASLTVAVMLGAFALVRLLRTTRVRHQPVGSEALELAASIVGRGASSEANVALTGDKDFLFHPDGDAFVMYRTRGRSAIALGDPVGNPAHLADMVWRFRELCDRSDLRCVFYQVTPRHLPLYIDLGLTFSKLGEEARVPLPAFTLEGKARQDLRSARNRAHREGASFEICPAARVPDIVEQLRDVSDGWLAVRRAREKGFSIGAFEPAYLARFDVAVVRVGPRIVAFANLWPAGDRSELSIDLMRHREDAPHGVMDYLFVELILWAKAQGFGTFSLGMAPLAGLEHHPLATLWNRVGNLVFRLGDEFYNFDGLRNYKRKFKPEWEPRYLAAPGGLALPRVLLDATTLISGGVKGVFAR